GGLWHGAAAHFAVWGAFHGLGLIAERALVRTLRGSLLTPLLASRLARALIVLATFHFACVAWVLVRADSLAQARRYLGAMVGLAPGEVAEPAGPVIVAGFVYLLCLALGHLLSGALGDRMDARWWPVRSAAYVAVAAFTLLLVPQSIQPFIYFQF